ncbi:tetratricopeptide repeat protein 31 isoform X2 [Ambystoma mexicanum]|uniref:tetratricopeptide repeat protein 31 isoform X2 n=1 Tax=Ambystoma mexicanum TaxID=8296 RepID=UPI0037E79020
MQRHSAIRSCWELLKDMMDFVKQMLVNEPEKLQQASSEGLAQFFEHIDPSPGYHYNYYHDMEDVDDDDDEYEDVSDDFEEEPSHIVPTTYCGLQKAFLTSHVPSSKQTSNNPFLNFKMPQQHIITQEEREQNAKELVAEEERIKNKAEKKKLKKQRQKDRKQQQKLEEELKNKKKVINEKKKESEKGSGDASSIKELEVEKKQSGGMSLGNGPPEDQSKNNVVVEAPPQAESTCSEYSVESEDDVDVEEQEDELDMSSTFVNEVWRKVESKPKVEKEKIIKKQRKLAEKVPEKLQEKKAEPNKNYVSGIDPKEQCDQFAVLGNSMASGGHFAAAVVYFTEAIKLNPRDYRLFGNRSYCWERMGRYNEALGDAEVSIGLYPRFLKGYFRKGKSLMGMKRYTEAMLAFKHILREDNTHVDAVVELKECERVMHLIRMNSGNKIKMPDLVPMQQGFRLPSPVGPKDYVKVETALGGLSLNSSRASSVGGDAPVFITTSGQKPTVPAASEKLVKGTKEPAGAAIQQKPPFTPSQLYPIWVGNVTSRITGDILLSYFKRFGPIHSIRILYDRTCAFVNFGSKDAAETAFTALQGAEVEGTKFILQLRHPDHASSTSAANIPCLVPKDGVKLPAEMECHFWRNAGCSNGERCRFRHIPESKGIDAK